MARRILKHIPAIFTDVDGVLIRGPNKLLNTDKIISYLNRPLH